MAAAVRVIQEPPVIDEHVTLIGTGDFGHQVVKSLRAALPDASAAAPSRLEEVFAHGRGPVVIALWRRSPALCEQADELAYRHHRTWLPIIMESSILRVGPVVRPPTGTCFRCYQTRRFQHDADSQVTAALDEAYDRDPDFGVRGHLPHHARLAAALARSVLATSATSPALADHAPSIATVNLLTSQITISHLIGLHGCDREDHVVPAPSDFRAVLAGLPRSVGDSRRFLAEQEVLA